MRCILAVTLIHVSVEKCKIYICSSDNIPRYSYGFPEKQVGVGVEKRISRRAAAVEEKRLVNAKARRGNRERERERGLADSIQFWFFVYMEMAFHIWDEGFFFSFNFLRYVFESFFLFLVKEYIVNIQ